MTQLLIRPAEPRDAREILAMITELAVFEKEPDAVLATEADLLRDGWGPHPKFEALMAERDGQVLGFALFFSSYSTWEGREGIYLEDLYVRDAARGLGVGRALVVRIAQLVAERGGKRLDLSVLTWNPARDVYVRLGFDHKSDWTGYRLTGDALAALAAGQ
jgi:GNAT superfamily N-acetyltransferase